MCIYVCISITNSIASHCPPHVTQKSSRECPEAKGMLCLLGRFSCGREFIINSLNAGCSSTFVV